MDVRNTILCMIKASPDLTKWKAYEHLFSTIGNGYRWYKGEIVSDIYFKAKLSKKQRDALIATDHFYGKISKFLEKRANDFRERKDTWIIKSINGFELINNVPKKITADWRKAVDEWNEELKRTSRVFDSIEDARADMVKQHWDRVDKLEKRGYYKNRPNFSNEEQRKLRKEKCDKEFKLIDFRYARDAKQRLDMNRIKGVI